MICIPKADDSEKRMKSNSMVGNTSCSLSKECKRLCEGDIRINGVKSYRKYKKRERNAKVKEELPIYKIRMILI